MPGKKENLYIENNAQVLMREQKHHNFSPLLPCVPPGQVQYSSVTHRYIYRNAQLTWNNTSAFSSPERSTDADLMLLFLPKCCSLQEKATTVPTFLSFQALSNVLLSILEFLYNQSKLLFFSWFKCFLIAALWDFPSRENCPAYFLKPCII